MRQDTSAAGPSMAETFDGDVNHLRTIAARTVGFGSDAVEVRYLHRCRCAADSLGPLQYRLAHGRFRFGTNTVAGAGCELRLAAFDQVQWIGRTRDVAHGNRVPELRGINPQCPRDGRDGGDTIRQFHADAEAHRSAVGEAREENPPSVQSELSGKIVEHSRDEADIVWSLLTGIKSVGSVVPELRVVRKAALP
ncbi:MAG: hypothetical protein MZV64_09745 [Ignavibacteriales bacterium]|nr:hypothetical protein [Ignavibacteriales bacterium]